MIKIPNQNRSGGIFTVANGIDPKVTITLFIYLVKIPLISKNAGAKKGRTRFKISAVMHKTRANVTAEEISRFVRMPTTDIYPK